jgi:hypothetical protein
MEQEDGDRFMKAFLKGKKAIFIIYGAIVLIQYLILGGLFVSKPLGWSSLALTLDYSYGFIRRGFIGTFINFISQALRVDVLPVILFTQFAGTAVLTALLFIFFFMIIKRTERASVKIMVLLFLALGPIGFYFEDWGELDIFLISLTVIACILIIKDRFIWLIPLIAAVCIMIHEGYVMMYLGVIIALLLYRSGVETDKIKQKNYRTCLFSTGLAATFLFVYFYFFSVSVSRDHIDKILVNAEQILNISFQENDWALSNAKYLYAGSGLPSNPMWKNGLPGISFYPRMFSVLMNILVCLPVILMLIDFWKLVILGTSDKKKRIILALCISLQMLTIPLVLSHSDQARWFYDVVYFNFLFITSVISIGDRQFTLAAEKCFAPSPGKVVLIVLYFIFFLNSNTQLISRFYQIPATQLTTFACRS